MHRMIPGSSVIDAKEVHATIMLLLLLLRFTHPTSHGVFREVQECRAGSTQAV